MDSQITKGQATIFDLKPSENMDYIERLNIELTKLKALLPLFDGRDPNLAKVQVDKVTDLINGINYTVNTGIGLNDMPSDKEFKTFITAIITRANEMRSADEATLMDELILSSKQEKTRRLKNDGDMAKPFLSIWDLPAFSRDATKNEIATIIFSLKAGIDFTKAVEKAEETRLAYNLAGVYDSTQQHNLPISLRGNMGSISGSIVRFASSVKSLMKKDKRANPEFRDSHIIRLGKSLKCNYLIMSPANIEATRNKYSLNNQGKTL